MKPKYRIKNKDRFLCVVYGCSFVNPALCRGRAENILDMNCRMCTGLKATKNSPGFTTGAHEKA